MRNQDPQEGIKTIRLNKLSLPYEKGADECLTEKDIQELAHQGIIRTTHYLQLAELYLMDLSKVTGGSAIDRQVEALSEITADFERQLSELITRK